MKPPTYVNHRVNARMMLFYTGSAFSKGAVIFRDAAGALVASVLKGSPTLTAQRLGSDDVHAERLSELFVLHERAKVLLLSVTANSLSEAAAMKALRRGRVIKDVEAEDTPQYETGRKSGRGRKMGYFLDDPIEFGKYALGDAPLSIRTIILRAPDYVTWCLDTFGNTFLSDEAFAFYKEHIDKRVQHAKAEKRDIPG